MRRPRLAWVLPVCVSACGVLSAGSAERSLRSGPTEDQIFEAVRQPPIALLQQLYNEHQLLVVSFQEHDNERQYRVLSTLLKRIGHDPRLRYIVFERFAESGPALEAASIKNLDESQLEQEVMQPFQNSPSPFTARDYYSPLCRPEWAFTWAKVLPRIRALDAARPAARPLLATGVDGAMASMLADKGIVSYERDSATAALFHQKIWQELA